MTRARRIALLTAAALLACAAVGLVGYEFGPVIAFDVGTVAPSWPYTTRLGSDLAPREAREPGHGKPSGDRVVIPRIAVNARVVAGRTDDALRHGVWLQPPSVAPGQPGTTVLAGHRIRSQFVLLHELRRGDVVLLYWKGREYDYRVRSTAVLDGDAPKTPVTVGGEEQLVLYTCTPRWEGNLRAVVYATPIATSTPEPTPAPAP
ncbi:MAG: sortase [Coriobacteriia bacterium]|nr:sortase [Coriobacteriia bacterium]